MKPLSSKNIHDYLQQNVFPHVNFITQGKIRGFKEAGGGLVSRVFRVLIDGTPIFLKQALPGEKKYEKIIKNIPKEFNLVFNDQRQIYEVKALRIFEKAVGRGIAPHVYYHDTKNNVMVLSEVGGSRAKLFEDIISREINLTASKKLAIIAAKLVNNTYGKIKPLRSTKIDKKIQLAKLKIQCLNVYQNLSPSAQKKVRAEQEKFVKESIKINKVLVHGDYHPRNILVDGVRVGTVDLEEAHLGDPSFDFGILLAHYLLRGIYHRKIRAKALRTAQIMYRLFLQKIRIPENKKRLENRLRSTIGGMMLGRLDGISSAWTWWIKKENTKKEIRKMAVKIILDKNRSFNSILEEFL